jgi:hypothetical protein
MNADGSGQTILSNNPAYDFDPAWSPDGTKIAFISGRDGNDEVYVMNADGSGQSNLSNNEWADLEPDWQALPANQAPVCESAGPSKTTLWPPNHGFSAINIFGVSDPEDDPFTIVIDSIFQDEAVNALGSGNTAPDGKGLGTAVAQVRRERLAPGNGRVYQIAFTAEDASGGNCTATVLVGVPLTRSGTAVDDGALFNSTVGP